MFKVINKHYLLLHIIVFIWGFSPVLGRFINTNAYQLVWFRVLLAVMLLFSYLRFTKYKLTISTKHFWQLAGIGLLIMIHWLAFYGAIKVSNISVTMVAFSTGTLFSSIIEPVFFKRRFRFYEIIIGLIIIAAIALIFSIETRYSLGIVLGIVAAFLSSLFSVLNGIMIHQLKSELISFYELLSALICLTLFLAFHGDFTTSFFDLDSSSIIGLLILSTVCTVFPFIASIGLSKYISPYTIVLTVNLESVYGIIWAIIFYNENDDVKPTFYVGVIIIFLVIFLNTYLKRIYDKQLIHN